MTVQAGSIVQQIVLERDTHRAQAEQARTEIAKLEEQIENLKAQFHQHLGAMQAKDETIRSIQALAQQSAANPDTDPNAHSDQ